MDPHKILRTIRKKQRELNRLVGTAGSLEVNRDLYRKSCELDRLIVEYMKHNQQLEILFPQI